MPRQARVDRNLIFLAGPDLVVGMPACNYDIQNVDFM